MVGMTEKQNNYTFKTLAMSFIFGASLMGIFHYYFEQPEEYRKTADRFLKPHTAVLISAMNRKKETGISMVENLKKNAKVEFQKEGMQKYNDAVISHNSIIEMVIASFDTGFDEASYKMISKLMDLSNSDWSAFHKWYKNDVEYKSVEETVFKTTFSPLALIEKVSDVALDSKRLKEKSREIRVRRMIENLRNCKMPKWDEVLLSLN